MPHIEDPIINELFQKRRNVIKTGLERMQAAYARLGKPANDIPNILIGGTNGKGTTSGFIYNVLAQAGLKVGIYTSPHILNFSERIQMSGLQISNIELISYLDHIKTQLPADEYDALSFFEVTTLMAYCCFARHRPDIMLVEVGMGGRWDATNVLSPMASVIVSIGLDHQEFLGQTIEDIAFEKSGIMRSNHPCFSGVSLETSAGRVLQAEAEKRLTKVWAAPQQMSEKDGYLTFALPDTAERFSVKLPEKYNEMPSYLRANFQLAVVVACWSLRTLKRPLADLAKFLFNHDPLPERRWPPNMWGRYHHLFAPSFSRPFLLDACHNVDGAQVFIQTVQHQYGKLAKLPALVSILGDKNINEILDVLSENLAPIYIYKQSNARTLQAEQLSEKFKQLPVFESFSDALEAARDIMTSDQHLPVVICGSIHGLGEAFQHLNIKIENTWH